jgi:hypothetical protein
VRGNPQFLPNRQVAADERAGDDGAEPADGEYAVHRQPGFGAAWALRGGVEHRVERGS